MSMLLTNAVIIRSNFSLIIPKKTSAKDKTLRPSKYLFNLKTFSIEFNATLIQLDHILPFQFSVHTVSLDSQGLHKQSMHCQGILLPR